MECSVKSQDTISIYECACGWHWGQDENFCEPTYCLRVEAIISFTIFFFFCCGCSHRRSSDSTQKYLYILYSYLCGYHAQWIEPINILYCCSFPRCYISVCVWVCICSNIKPIGIGYCSTCCSCRCCRFFRFKSSTNTVVYVHWNLKGMIISTMCKRFASCFFVPFSIVNGNIARGCV